MIKNTDAADLKDQTNTSPVPREAIQRRMKSNMSKKAPIAAANPNNDNTTLTQQRKDMGY